MIEGKNFRIIEDKDILKACNFLEDAAIGMLKEQEKDHDEHDQYILDFVSNIFTTISAAGIGAAVARTQGGLVLMKEGYTQEDQKEAETAMEELRKKYRAAAAATTGGIPQ